MLRFRELETSALYAGLGVRLIDELTGGSPIGWVKLDLEVDEAGSFHPISPPRVVNIGGVVWFPWLERYRDARSRTPRKYRVRVATEFYTPRYRYDAEGLEALVEPYDDVRVPASLPDPLEARLLPAASYPFQPGLPVLRGAIVDALGAAVPGALVTWTGGAVTNTVLSDEDGDFDLPLSSAPLNTPIDVHAERPAPPPGGRSGDTIVRIPQDLSIFKTIQIV